MTKADTPVGDEVPARFATGGHDAEAFGAHAGYPKGDRATFRNIELLVGSHSHLDEIVPARLIHRAPTPSRLVRITEPKVTYRFQGASLTVDDYLARTPTTGLLVARGNTILVERYQYGRTDRHRLTSWSMAKTVTAMLVGIAIAERCIRSVDDLAATYVPELAGTEYGRTSLRHLLQMSSGVRFSEEYTGGDDIARLAATTYLLRGRGGSTAVRPFNDRAAEAGTRVSYASAETQVLGLVLRGATDRPVAEYLQSKVWQEIGTEADASWLIDNSGQEATFMGLNAVLRDYGAPRAVAGSRRQLGGPSNHPRGVGHGRDHGTRRPTASPPRHSDAGLRLRLQIWILRGERRMFMLWGIRGQRIFVDPQSKLVMVNTAVHKLPVDLPPLVESGALWYALVRQLGE